MFNVVLVEPEIPPNTGNVGRLCLATKSTLHLVKPLGFSLDDRELKRAGLDYWQDVDLKIWDSLPAMMKSKDASPVPLGSQGTANKRTIYKFIHQGGIQSCQLVMGLTALEPGSVWNSFPPHTHWRRTEIYFYFDLGENARFSTECGAQVGPHMLAHSCLDQGQNGGGEKKHDRHRRDEKFRPEVREVVQHNRGQIKGVICQQTRHVGNCNIDWGTLVTLLRSPAIADNFCTFLWHCL